MGTRPESTRGVLEARGGGEGGLSEDVSYRIAVSSHDGYIFIFVFFSFVTS